MATAVFHGKEMEGREAVHRRGCHAGEVAGRDWQSQIPLASYQATYIPVRLFFPRVSKEHHVIGVPFGLSKHIFFFLGQIPERRHKTHKVNHTAHSPSSPLSVILWTLPSCCYQNTA